MKTVRPDRKGRITLGKLTKEYHEVIDGLFSLHPGAFRKAMALVFDSDCEKSESKRKELKDILFENGVYPSRDDG